MSCPLLSQRSLHSVAFAGFWHFVYYVSTSSTCSWYISACECSTPNSSKQKHRGNQAGWTSCVFHGFVITCDTTTKMCLYITCVFHTWKSMCIKFLYIILRFARCTLKHCRSIVADFNQQLKDVGWQCDSRVDVWYESYHITEPYDIPTTVMPVMW